MSLARNPKAKSRSAKASAPGTKTRAAAAERTAAKLIREQAAREKVAERERAARERAAERQRKADERAAAKAVKEAEKAAKAKAALEKAAERARVTRENAAEKQRKADERAAAKAAREAAKTARGRAAGAKAPPRKRTAPERAENSRAASAVTVESIARLIREAYLEATNGAVKQRVLLKDLRPRVGVQRDDFDQALLSMQRQSKVVLMGLDNPLERTPEVEAAALHIAGNPRHLVYFQG